MEKIYKDLVIIGAGPGGYEMAGLSSNAGLNVCLIEKEELGGTCLNCGCIPTKTYNHYAEIIEEVAKAFNKQIDFNFVDIYNKKEQVINNLRLGIAAGLKNVDIIKGKAKLKKENDNVLVNVDDKQIIAKWIVLATGSKEQILNIKGIELAKTSKELLALDYIPKSLTIIGGGVIGLEMASIYNAYGCKVSIIEYFPSILPHFDKEATRRLTNLVKAKGIDIYPNSAVYEIAKSNDMLDVKAKSLNEDIVVSSEVVLSCTGRIANVDELGLDEVGIDYTSKGIIVNDYKQTNIKNIYAIGDCTGGIMLAHKASFDGKVALSHILGKTNHINFDVIPACVFSIPELSSVGLTEEEVINKGIEYKTVKEMYRTNGKAQAIDAVDGFVKLIVADDYIIGATIIGKDANLLIHEISVLMNNKVKVSVAKEFIHAHPTLSEVIQSALQKA